MDRPVIRAGGLMAVSILVVVNFAHPLTESQREEIAAAAGLTSTRVISADNQLDLTQPLAPQVRAMVDAVGLTATEWQTAPLVVVLPGLSASAAAVVAEVHGRTGYFPTVAAFRRVEGAVPEFRFTELLPLQELRDRSRAARGSDLVDDP